MGYTGLTDRKLKQMVANSIKKVSSSNSKFTMQLYLMESLERRLEIIIWRSHFVLSVRNSQQLISHGHVFVNGCRITKKNYLVKRGDIITFYKNIHSSLVNYVIRSNMWPIPPKYIEIN